MLLRTFFLLLLITTLNLSTNTLAQSIDKNAEFFGAFRTVYSYVNTQDRAGISTDEHTLNARIHLGINYSINPDLKFGLRLAGRFSTNQDDFRFVLDDHTGGGGAYPAGVTTFDSFYLQWQASKSLRITGGRFQARFPLAGFIPKAMDRYYAANLSISHTDGLWFQWDIHTDWRTHLIISHNGKNGSTHAARSPLDFSSNAARISYLAQLEHRETNKRWVQRELSISFNPDTFIRDDDKRGLLTISSRAMMRLPYSLPSGELWAGGEFAISPEAPRPIDAGINVDEDRTLFGKAPIAWQVSAYANNFVENHRLGILYGQTEPHWLVSSSFRPNNTMAEIRYRYTYSSRLSFDVRYRLRTDLFTPSNAMMAQEDRDFYARFTYRF